MTREVLAFLQPEKGGVFVDCTVGMGGHALALLEAGATKVIGLDRDPAALRIAAETLSKFRDRVELVHSDYRAIRVGAGGPRDRSRRRHADRHGHVVVSARSRGTRVQLSARRPARHADGYDDRDDGGRVPAPRGGDRRSRTRSTGSAKSAFPGASLARSSRRASWRRSRRPLSSRRSCGGRCPGRGFRESIRRRARFKRFGSG